MNFWKFLLKVIAIIILVLLVMASFGIALPGFLAAIPWISSLFTWMGGLFAAGSWGTIAALAMGALAVADPDAMEAVGEVAGDAAGAIGGAVGGALGGVVDGLFSSPVLLVGGAFLVWALFFRKKKEDTVVISQQAAEPEKDIDSTTGKPLEDPSSSYLPAPAGGVR